MDYHFFTGALSIAEAGHRNSRLRADDVGPAPCARSGGGPATLGRPLVPFTLFFGVLGSLFK